MGDKNIKLINDPNILKTITNDSFFARNCICLCYPFHLDDPCPIESLQYAFDKDG